MDSYMPTQSKHSLLETLHMYPQVKNHSSSYTKVLALFTHEFHSPPQNFLSHAIALAWNILPTVFSPTG